MGLGGVQSVLSAAVEEVISLVSRPRALLELGEGRRGPGEGTAGVTERAGRRSELEAGVGGDPRSGSRGPTVLCPQLPACWPLLPGPTRAVRPGGQQERQGRALLRPRIQAGGAGGTRDRR